MRPLRACTMTLVALATTTACGGGDAAPPQDVSQDDDRALGGDSDDPEDTTGSDEGADVAPPTLVHVNAAATPAGDGSKERPFLTIQTALAALAGDGRDVTILVAPGTYLGPVVIERARTTLRGDSRPTFDADGYLLGFEAPVTLTMDRLLVGVDYRDRESGVEPEDLVEIRADGVTVRGFVFDSGRDESGRPLEQLNDCNAVSAKAEDDGFYADFEIRDNVFQGIWDGAIWTRKASGVVRQNQLEGGGFVGITATGGDGETPQVTVERNAVRGWEAGICVLGLWENPIADNGDSRLVSHVRDNIIAGGEAFYDVFPEPGVGLLVAVRGSQSNLAAVSAVELAATGNRFEDNPGPAFYLVATTSGRPTASAAADVHLDDNRYADNAERAVIRFRTWDASPIWVSDTIVTLFDGDGVIDPSTIDLGPADNNNRLTVTD